MKIKLIAAIILLSASAVYGQKQWTLQECVEYALEQNISIQENELNLELAKKQVDIAKGNFLPDLGAGTRGNFNFGTSFDPRTNDRISTSLFGGSMNLNSGITIFNGFRNTNTYKQAQLGVESSILSLKMMENDISLRVVNGYLNILFAKENLKAAQVQAAISKQQIEAARIQFEEGVVPKGDLLNVESTAATDLQNVVNQENNLDIAILRLAQLLQLPSDNFDIASVDVGKPSANLFYKTSDEVYNKSLEVMPEITRAELAIKNEDLDIQIAKSDFLPRLTGSVGLSTNYGFNLNLPPGFENTAFTDQLSDNFGYGFGFNLNIPIFNRFQTKNRVAQANINKEISKIRLENEKLNLEQTIEQAFLDVVTALKTYEASKISLEAQEEAFKNAQERYNFGDMTLFDFDQVRTRFVNAQAALIRSKYDYVFKTKVLQFYSGELSFE